MCLLNTNLEKCALIIRDGARTKEGEEGEEGLHVKKVCRVNTDFPVKINIIQPLAAILILINYLSIYLSNHHKAEEVLFPSLLCDYQGKS